MEFSSSSAGSSRSSPGEGYAKALDLLQQLQNTIESQQKDIAKLHGRIKSLKEQNEELRKERDELRLTNAANQSHIAELTRRNSSKSGSAIQRYFSTPEPSSTTQAIESEPVYIEPPIIVKVEKEEEEEAPSVTLRQNTSRDNIRSASRKGVYVPTPPTPRRSSRRETIQQQDSEEQHQNESIEQPDPRPDQEEEEEEEEDTELEMSITPIPHHLLDSERPHSSMSELSSNEGSVTSIDEFRSLTPSSLGSTVSPVNDPLMRLRHSIGSVGSGYRMSLGGSEDDDQEMAPTKRNRLATIGQIGHIRNTRGSVKNETSQNGSGGNKATPLRRQNSFPRRGKTVPHDNNYLSPDMEMKIQSLIQQALGKKYGGLERASRAATVIQRGYRKYKLNAHFKMLRSMQQQHSTRQRRRTMSVRHHRKPSIMKHKSKNLTSATKMEEIRDKFKTVTQTSLSPSISRRELRGQKPSPFTLSKEDISLPNVPEIISPDEEEEEGDEPIGELLPRSPSVFSGISIGSLNEYFPQESRIPRQLSRSSVNRKTNIGTNIFNRKPIKGIQYLVYHGVLKDDPLEVAKFLKNQYGLSKEKIGEFVGEIRCDFNMAVLECMVQLIDLSNKTIDEALRSFQQLFRMPGEAQKIDNAMQIFAGEYYNSNIENGIIKSEDAAYVLSFAIMMLHTDLHNPSVKRHMTKNDWIRMNRGNNDNQDYPEDFLISIYERIQQNEFATGRDHTDEVADIKKQITGSGCPQLRNPQRRFIRQFHVLQVNDMHKRAIRRHRRVLFLFNDVLLVVKSIAANKYEYRKFFTLLHAQAMQFHTNNYKFGVAVQHELSGETYHCNCENEESKKELLGKLDDAIFELKEMEKERMTEGFKNKDGVEKVESDLLGSKSLSSSADDLHALSIGGGDDKVDFRRSPDPATNIHKDSTKRTSKDSGFDSPVTTSPSPNSITEERPPNPLGERTVASPTPNGTHLLASPKREPLPPRSRTPEPRKTMKVIPNSPAKDSSKYLTLNPSSPKQKGKSKDRQSMPPDAMSLLREHSSLRPQASYLSNSTLSKQKKGDKTTKNAKPQEYDGSSTVREHSPLSLKTSAHI